MFGGCIDVMSVDFMLVWLFGFGFGYMIFVYEDFMSVLIVFVDGIICVFVFVCNIGFCEGFDVV